MDRLKVMAMLGGTMTPVEVSAEKLVSIQMWDSGKFQARFEGAVCDGMPITHLQLRRVDIVLAYMDRREPKK